NPRNALALHVLEGLFQEPQVANHNQGAGQPLLTGNRAARVNTLGAAGREDAFFGDGEIPFAHRSKQLNALHEVQSSKTATGVLAATDGGLERRESARW